MTTSRREHRSAAWAFWLALVCLIACCRAAFAGNPDFSRPTQTFTADDQLAPLVQEIAQQQYPDAAARLDALLREHGDEMMTTENGGLISVQTWFELLPAQAKAAITPEYRNRFDADARNALDAVRRNPGYSVADLYTVARRYPLSSVAGQALALAAHRAMETADAPAALALYTLAERSGWVMTDPETRRAASLRSLAEGNLLASETGAPGSARAAPAVSSRWPTGAIPFDAPWYGKPGAYAQPRFFPLETENDLLLIGPSAVLRAHDTGVAFWSWAAQPTPGASPVPPHSRDVQPTNLRRGPLYAGALLEDVYGRAQILVVRQPTDREDACALRAFRAADGKLLWDTRDQPDLHDECFAGTPAVCGRYTYAIALAVNMTTPVRGALADSATLSLFALDTISGQLIWQCPLGSYSTPRSHRGHAMDGPPTWLDAWDHTEPAVSGDGVFLTAAPGTALRIGRFDGKIQWLRIYGPDPDPVDLSAWRHGHFHAEDLPPIDPKVAIRFRDTPVVCRGVLVAAPADNATVFGFDSISGQKLWENAELAGATLVGASLDAVLLQSDAVIAIDPRTSRTLWNWKPKSGAITGPAVLRRTPDGPVLLVPTTAEVSRLDPRDGSAWKSSAAVVDFHHFAQSDPGKKLLETMGASKSFGPPASP